MSEIDLVLDRKDSPWTGRPELGTVVTAISNYIESSGGTIGEVVSFYGGTRSLSSEYPDLFQVQIDVSASLTYRFEDSREEFVVSYKGLANRGRNRHALVFGIEGLDLINGSRRESEVREKLTKSFKSAVRTVNRDYRQRINVKPERPKFRDTRNSGARRVFKGSVYE